MAAHHPSLFPIASSPALPPVFHYCAEAITHGDERRLVDQIADLPFTEFQFHGFEGKRRVVSFGWRYDFSGHKVVPAVPVPPFLLDVYHKVQAASGSVLPRVQQVLVAEYGPGAPIGCGDIKEDGIQIERSWYKGRYEAPKTPKSERTVGVPDEILEQLTGWIANLPVC